MDISKSRSTEVTRGPMSPHGPKGDKIGETADAGSSHSAVIVQRPNLAQTRNLGPDGPSSGTVPEEIKIVRTSDRKISRP